MDGTAAGWLIAQRATSRQPGQKWEGYGREVVAGVVATVEQAVVGGRAVTVEVGTAEVGGVVGMVAGAAVVAGDTHTVHTDGEVACTHEEEAAAGGTGKVGWVQQRWFDRYEWSWVEAPVSGEVAVGLWAAGMGTRSVHMDTAVDGQEQGAPWEGIRAACRMGFGPEGGTGTAAAGSVLGQLEHSMPIEPRPGYVRLG